MHIEHTRNGYGAYTNARQIVNQAVALSNDLSASFNSEAQSVTLIGSNGLLCLDREETYRLFSLLEAEFKGV